MRVLNSIEIEEINGAGPYGTGLDTRPKDFFGRHVGLRDDMIGDPYWEQQRQLWGPDRIGGYP